MRVLVLGGYGNFGAVIARSLAADSRFVVTVAGRDAAKAEAFADAVGARPKAIDADDPLLAQHFADCGAQLVISTAGPFQGQDYRVARAAIAARAHYVDIADGRAFVCGIESLDAEAKRNDVLVVSGASSVPALSSAVVDRYASEFAALRAIEVGISASAAVPGQATLEAVLGYCGRAFPQWRNGQWVDVWGWQGLRRHVFRESRMSRWLASCDVPDLTLFPRRYPTAQTVTFVAGVEPMSIQLGLWLFSWAVRFGIVRELRSRAAFLGRVARALERFGSGRSGMWVRLSGLDVEGRERVRTWELAAQQDHGRNVPCMAAVAMASKLARGEITARGATACVGLLSLQDYLEELRPWNIAVHHDEG